MAKKKAITDKQRIRDLNKRVNALEKFVTIQTGINEELIQALSKKKSNE